MSVTVIDVRHFERQPLASLCDSLAHTLVERFEAEASGDLERVVALDAAAARAMGHIDREIARVPR